MRDSEKISLMKGRIVRRRRGGLGALGSAGISGALWLGTSTQWAAGFLRDRLNEASEAIEVPKFRPQPELWDPNRITVSWLGHATVLIDFYGIRILTDPVLFPKVGAHFKVGTIGPKRLVGPGLSVQELPSIDIALLSHAHMDHFDLRTLRTLPRSTRAVTARSTTDLFQRTRLRDVTELSWGESTRIQTPQGDVRIEAFQVKHWGARWRRDTFRGYNGYILEREGRKILFGGDTAYSENFAAIRSKGPFEVACMPIGAYQPWVISHCTPEEALTMANAAGGRHIVPIHHQTFRLGREGRYEPIERLQAALEQEADRLAVSHVGETFTLS
jgi:L-ascorbate metabolism protein UlaG (beta-lactamase superfamily)